jgi:DNA-binding GntR family transcriptional regulator
MTNAAAIPPRGSLDELYAVIFDLLRPSDSAAIPTALDHAYDMIWQQLIKRERQPGERLQDTELAAQLGLSRTPVRQALHRLAQEDLVRFDARRGFSVRVFTAKDVREIYDVRCALEVLAIRQAAPYLTQEDLQAQLRSLHAARQALHPPRNQRAVILHLEADLKLHNMLIHASGNRRLTRILGALRSQQALFQYWDTSYPERNEAASHEHERILLALISRDTGEASRAMADHIINARDRVLTDLFHLPATPGSVSELGPAGSQPTGTVPDRVMEQS